MAKIYVASKYEEKEEVNKVYKILEEKGHTITYKWTKDKFNSAEDLSTQKRKLSIEDLFGIVKADIFIFLAGKKLKYNGSNTELGIAIGRAAIEVVIIGHGIDENIFAFHPKVARFETLNEYLGWI
jgi:hypothetical protein